MIDLTAVYSLNDMIFTLGRGLSTSGIHEPVRLHLTTDCAYKTTTGGPSN